MILPTSLTAAGIAALINFWLALRCGQARGKENVSVGDGGSEFLIRRMRAHANFIEFTPIVLILIGLIEYATGTSMWLWVVMAIYMLGRVAHAFGMDGAMKARMAGAIITTITTLGLGLYAVALPHITGAQTVDASAEVVPAE
jgi:uncharacterized protein